MAPALADTLPALLAEQLAADATRPLITYYDDATGERVELSVSSFDNAVAKTANLLQDELGTEPGISICLLLPTHWQTAVWVFAAAACGLRLIEDPSGCDVVVCAPDTLAQAVATGARDVVALALRPLGGPFIHPLPTGVVDHGADTPGQPDVFIPAVPVTADLPFLTEESQGQALLRARARGLRGRLMTDLSPATSDGLVEGLLAAVAGGGSLVFVRHADPTIHERRSEQEQVTTTIWDDDLRCRRPLSPRPRQD
jgi:uncharacterized protein (TIGR03089 family)